MSDHNLSERVESEQERLNRQLDQLLNPTAFHRLVFRSRDKPHLIAISSRFAIAGLVCLAVAMNGAVLLVTDVLFDRATVVVTVAVTAALYIGLWFVLGTVRRLGRERSH